jgi:hypothetical protein
MTPLRLRRADHRPASPRKVASAISPPPLEFELPLLEPFPLVLLLPLLLAVPLSVLVPEVPLLP